MTLSIYQIDAFTNTLFRGNPAAVCPMEQWLEDDQLLSIAKENNLAETAYFKQTGDGVYDLRWFTPEIEMDLCGHATLATAFVIFNEYKYKGNEISFNTQSGIHKVKKIGEMYELDFPSRPPKQSYLPDIVNQSLSLKPLEIYKSRDLVLVFESEEDVKNLSINPYILKNLNLDPGGIICTSTGNDVDFVSRFFTPGAAVFEDPVTGSAHCTLIPFWANRLKKTSLKARQLSERSGELECELVGDRVKIRGQAIKYLEGKISI